jgi:hypothetical protein
VGVVGAIAASAVGAVMALVAATSSPPPAPPADAVVAVEAPVSAAAATASAQPEATLPSIEAAPSPPEAPNPVVSATRAERPTVTPPGATVKPEMEQLAAARSAVASDPARALALAEEGHARFPRGVFWQEREGIAIGALARLGRAAEAKQRARAFLERHPESPFAEGMRRLAEGG